MLLTPVLAADPAPVQLKEVTVTATQDALAERHAAVAQKTVIDRQEIEALGGLTIGEVIGKLPGIDAGQHGGDGSPSANARGMGRDAVQILVDGERPAANSRYALTMVGRQPTGELERIEILRGASAEHGGGAPVTVNLVMRKARPKESITLRAAAGMRGDEPNGQFTASRGGGEGGFSWLLPVTVNHHGMPLEKQAARTSATASGTLNHNERESSPYTLDEFILSPRFTWKSSDANLTLWPSYYRNRGERNGELEAATRARTLLDAHLVRRLTPALNLRLSAQNLLREDTRRASSAYSASDAWTLATGERGQRTWLASLEGKW